MKVADVDLLWKRSPSNRNKEQRIEVSIDGSVTVDTVVPVETESFRVEVKAEQTLSFRVFTIGDDGEEVVSETYTYTFGDFQSALPATDLTHVVVSIRDVDEEPVPNPPIEPLSRR